LRRRHLFPLFFFFSKVVVVIIKRRFWFVFLPSFAFFGLICTRFKVCCFFVNENREIERDLFSLLFKGRKEGRKKFFV